jgi:phosphatidylinositol alpha 1,6-mannosyltransferase
MRVAIVSESFLPTVNGVTNSVRKVLEHLRDHGHDAIVLVPAAGAPRSYAGFRVHEVPALAYRQFPVGLPSPAVARVIQDFMPDVVHAASPFLLGAQAIAAAGRAGIPSVAVFQTDVAGYARRNRLGAATKFAWRVVRWIHEGADLTLVPSSASMRDLEAAGIERLARWARGVDLTTYHPNNRLLPTVERLRQRLAPNGETIVGYVGRIAPEKQVDRLAVLRDVPGIRLAIVGDGPAAPAVRRALRGMPVTWFGALTGQELAAAYASFDLFVHTGTEETFGQTVQEAHASGLAVVAPRAGGPIDLVDHGSDGLLFSPEDDAALRSAVLQLVANPERRARMGEAGRRKVLGRSWSAVGAELIEHYGSVIAARALEDVLLAREASVLPRVPRFD